jgi:beta-lactamase superfamily II metal-dependent hydrolase
LNPEDRSLPELDFWLLNVGHGDSIVLRYTSAEGSCFGLVDSNCFSDNVTPPALAKLQSLGAQELAFVMLTHPHADHYRGMLKVLEAYRGKISAFLCFPAGEYILANIKKLRPIFEKLSQTEGSAPKAAEELLGILLYAKQEAACMLRWTDCVGPRNDLFINGLQGAAWEILQPLPKAKGVYFNLLEKGDVAAVNGSAPNNMSVALRVSIAGTSIVLGGDTTYRNWYDHRHQTYGHNYRTNATVLKVPHHGSRDDVKPDMFDYWFAPKDATQRVGLISADGRRHPFPEVLHALRAESIHPYCTNLARSCGGSRVEAIFSAADVSKQVRRIINAGEVELQPNLVQVCQGEIHVHLNGKGEITVQPQYAHPCGFRGDYQRLGLGLTP